jgi:predicted flap endonuclease-1-like 5' DNA nuclease
MATIEANWLVFGIALLAALLIGWWLFGRASKAPPRQHRPDVLDEGQAPAQRNQALIDAPPAAQITPPPLSGTMAGLGETIAVAAQDQVEEVVARAAPPPPPPPPPPEIEPAPEPEPAPPSPPEIAPEPEPTLPSEPQPEIEPAPASPPEIAPAPEPIPAPIVPEAAPAAPAADDLARIKGLGPKLQALLPELGITTFAQIAALSEADLAELDTKLGPFAGRPARDGWVEQAGYLATGDIVGFEARFGKV